MSDETKPAPKKKGKLKTILMVTVGALVLLGGGIGAGLYAAGAGMAGGAHKEKEDPNTPKLVAKDGHAESDDHGGEKKAKSADDAIDPGKYKASYYDLAQNFTSNMRDSDGFMQVAIGVSTFYDQRVLDRVKEHEMAIRSSILMTLADQDSFVVSTPEGKKALQKALKKAINDVLIEKEGFGGIDDVYFTNFIIQ